MIETTYICLLRGINVGGQKKIKMDELERLFAGLGFKNVKTYIQSGNVVFRSPNLNHDYLAKKIEKRIKEVFGFDVTVLIRTGEDIEKLIERNPFAKKDPIRLYVTFLSDEPKNFSIKEINAAKSKAEEFAISGKEIYFFCPDGYGRTKLSNNFFEKKLNVSATTRNWNSVNKLHEIACLIQDL